MTESKKAAFFVFMSSVLFATGGLFFKIATWSSLAISSARSIIAFTGIMIFLLIKKHHFVVNRSVIFAALSISCTNTLFAMANKLTTAGNTIVLQFSMPVFVILIMVLFFHKRPTGLEIITCILVLSGIICFFVDSLSAGNMVGNALALISGISYAGYFVSNSREDSDPFTAVVLSYAITAIIGLPWLLKTDIAATAPAPLMAVIALGILQQMTAQLFFSAGIKKTEPITAALISGIEPVLNPVLVAVFCREILSPLSLIGGAIVLISIIGYNVISARLDTVRSKGV